MLSDARVREAYDYREGECFGWIAIPGAAFSAAQSNLNRAGIGIEEQICIRSELWRLRDLGNIPEKGPPLRSMTANKAVVLVGSKRLRAQTLCRQIISNRTEQFKVALKLSIERLRVGDLEVKALKKCKLHWIGGHNVNWG